VIPSAASNPWVAITDNPQWLSPTEFQAAYDITSLIPKGLCIIKVSDAVGLDGLATGPNSDGTFTVDYAGSITDKTPPLTPSVTVWGDGSLTDLSASWSSSDLQSGINLYRYAIGSTPGKIDMVNWTNTTATSMARTGLILIHGQTYYVSVQARNGGGIWSNVGASSGVVAGMPPLPTFTPTSWSYGVVNVGTTSAGKTFTVKNTGTGNLVIGSVTLAGINPTQFHLTVNNCSSATLIPNGTCSLTATFGPTTTGAKTAYINIPDNATGNPHQIALSGTGGIPTFTSTPTTWNYGVVKVGTTSTGETFTIKNTGTANLVIGTVTLAGTNPGQFHLTANTCSAHTLTPNGTCTLTATFAPTAASTMTSYMNIPDNAAGNPHKITLSGKGGTEQSLNGGFNMYPTTTAKIPTYWSAVNFAATDGKDTINKIEGTASVKIANTSVRTKTLSQTRSISGIKGNTFLFSLWGKAQSIPTTTGVAQAQVLLYNGTKLVQAQTITFPNGTYIFTKKTLTFTASGAYTQIVIRLIYSKGSGSIWFDGLSLLKSP
jgi:hypothetical protein